jgi:ParB family transcriptional regulator, chromosome partitioning protein
MPDKSEPFSEDSADAPHLLTDRNPDSQGTPIKIAPDKIRRNPANPRVFFNDTTIQRLAESIEKVGVLVPVTVYHDPNENSSHVLLDGERRWRAAIQINYPEIPAWEIVKPEGVDNTLTMFNIHMLREEWSEIATAWALQKLMEDLNTDDVKKLRELTGLSADRIRNMRIVLNFPREYQEMVARENNPIPFNFFVELHKNVLSWVTKKPDAVLNQSTSELTESFLKKYESNALGDVVDLRKVNELIQTGRSDDYVGQKAREAVEHLLTTPDATVLDAYAAGAAAGAEMRTIVRDIKGLPGRIEYLMTLDLHADQRARLRTALGALRDDLENMIDELGEQ